MTRLSATTLRVCFVATALAAGAASRAEAGSVLARVQASATIRCGAVARPGLLDFGAGAPRGLFVDLCRAFGAAAGGPSAAIRITAYGDEASLEAVRRGDDDVFFLSGSEIVDGKLAGQIIPGPPAFIASTGLMVAGGAPFQRPDDLAGQPICFLQGDVSHRHLEAFFAARGLSFVRMGFQEEGEMFDAFDAQACRAMAGETTMLAEARHQGGRSRTEARILDEPLASFPILVATSVRDGEWAAIVAWTLAILLDADRPSQLWRAGGLDSLPIDAAALGLQADWRRAALAAAGGYARMRRRNVGEDSPLRLSAGPNALWGEGGAMTPPYAE